MSETEISSNDKQLNDEKDGQNDSKKREVVSGNEVNGGNVAKSSSGDEHEGELEALKPRKNEGLDLFSSRREGTDMSANLSNINHAKLGNNSSVPSIFNDKNKSLPAWLNNKPGDKYDKYGQRSINSNRNIRGEDDRYSKYMLQPSAENRVKRSWKEDEENGDRKRQHESPEASEAAPYDKLAVSNQSSGVYQPFQSSIYNRGSKDINSIVRTHYNQRTQQSRFQGSRTQSPIYKLRNFNNAIKYILLNEWTPRSPTPDRPTTLLDLCCGKGGDLNKCEFVDIGQYIGVDISDLSIKEAFSRYSRNKARFIPAHDEKKRKKDTRRYNFEACFATGDCFSTPIPEILEPNFPGIINSLFPVDCVSMQFSMHYAFETEDKVNGMLMNVSKSLRPGGRFIGTIPSSDFIRDKIMNRHFIDPEGKKFGNDLYSVAFKEPPPADGIFKPPFGREYNYTLKDAIDDVPEYVVPFEAFRGMCENYGLTLKYKKNFVDIFNQEFPKYFHKLNKNLIEGMKRSDGKYGAEGSEKEVVGFYLGFVFEKDGA